MRVSLSLVFLSICSAALTEEFSVSDPASFATAAKKASAGDTIILRNGAWSDAKLKIFASGTAESPITVRAETPGKVILTGDSRISIAGEYIVVEGLWFQNPTGEESIELRTDSDKLARGCRVTQCVVSDELTGTERKGSSRFVSVYGVRNRIDHCYFAGKTTEGPTMVIWLAEGSEAAHQIDHNYFGPRPRLGRNGGETIRLGDSKTSMLTAACVVEHNLFERCDGEAECISNKSCGNLYRNNRFVGVSGTLTLRHGNHCRVEDNVFIGDGARGAGGVRVIGTDHVVIGNRFEDLTGDDERSALCFMMGIPDSPENGYFQVERASITENVFLNCEHNILIAMSGDKKATLPPVDTVISKNMIQTNEGEAFEIRTEIDGVTMEENFVEKDRPASVTNLEELISEPAGPSWRN